MKFKNPAIWLGVGILHLTQEPDFSKTSGLNRIINVIMVHDLDKKNLHIKRLFFAKSKWGIFGHYAQNKIFSQKYGSVSFLPLRHSNFMKSFTKILWAVLEKTCFPTDIMTYQQQRNHRRRVQLSYWNLIDQEPFLAIIWEPGFSRACSFCRMLMNLRFTRIPGETNDLLFLVTLA